MENIIPKTCSECKDSEQTSSYIICKLTGKKVGVIVACYERINGCPKIKETENE